MRNHNLRTLLAGAASIAALWLGVAEAAPITTLDRHGAYVSVEAYGPNVVHVIISPDQKDLRKGAGYGILANHADNSAFRQTTAKDGDTFTSSALSLHVDAAAPPRVPGTQEKYFAPSIPPVNLHIENAKGDTLLSMTGWEMSPHVVTGEKTYRVGASFATSEGEHYYGGQWVKVAAPIDQIPIFVKAGSIVPIGSDVLSTATKQTIMSLKVYPGKDGTFSLYDDDGSSYDYEKGKGTTTTILTWNDVNQTLTATGGDKYFVKSALGLVSIAGH